MLKCLFVDLTSIKSAIPKSKFDKAQIEKLADSILATDGSIVPLILSRDGSKNGVDRYTIIEGHLTYYAALKAKEKDLRKAEMVNAFVIPAEHQQAAIEQLALLAAAKSTVVESEPPVETVKEAATPTNPVNIDELLDRLSADIARQLLPLSQQIATVAATVDRHERMLEVRSSTTAVAPPPVEPTVQKEEPAKTTVVASPPVKPTAEKEKTKTTTTSRKTTKKQPAQVLEVSPAPTVTPSDLPAAVTIPKQSTVTKKTAATENPPKSDAFPGIEPAKLAKTLQLVNTSSVTELALMMSRSGITNAQTLATSLIAKRDNQPHQRFESWEAILLTKVAKLTQKLAIDIITKLK
jgi:hypothetical protein